MKYTIEIDDSTKAGKSLIEIAREMAKTLKGIKVMKLDQNKEDKALGIMIEEGMKSGLADKKMVLKEMGIG